MNEADWLIAGLVGISTLVSILRGFIKEALSLLTWVAAISVSLVFNQGMQQLLQPYIETPSLRQAASIGLLFFVVLILGGLVNYLLASLVKATGLTGTDRILGLVFGFVRGVLVVLVLLILVPEIVPIEQDLWYRQSVLIPRVMMLESWCMETAADIWSLVDRST